MSRARRPSHAPRRTAWSTSSTECSPCCCVWLGPVFAAPKRRVYLDEPSDVVDLASAHAHRIRAVNVGQQELEGQTLDLPPVLVGSLGSDPKKETILLYGHYDVQPALMSDGWKHEPFTLTHDKETDRLYGRGSSDDKGPILGWLNVIQAHKETDTEMPVNLKFCFEGMEESGSEGLEELVVKEAKGEFKDVSATCISDSYWLGTTKPCLTNGLRGLSYFSVSISGPGADLHSGVHGGVVHEPMTDLFALFSKLVTPQGKILIPGINDKVAPLTPEERKLYEALDMTVADLEGAVGGKVVISDDKVDALMARMRYPSAPRVLPSTVQIRADASRCRDQV